jgi:hypothetical protein
MGMLTPKGGLLALGCLLAAACGSKAAGPGKPDAGSGDAAPAQPDGSVAAPATTSNAVDACRVKRSDQGTARSAQAAKPSG